MSRLCLSFSWMVLSPIFFLPWLDNILSQTSVIRGDSYIIVTSFLSALALTLMPRYTTSVCPLRYSSIHSEKIITFIGEFLLVQWLRLWAFTAECPGSIPRGGNPDTWSRMAWQKKKKKGTGHLPMNQAPCKRWRTQHQFIEDYCPQRFYHLSKKTGT